MRSLKRTSTRSLAKAALPILAFAIVVLLAVSPTSATASRPAVAQPASAPVFATRIVVDRLQVEEGGSVRIDRLYAALRVGSRFVEGPAGELWDRAGRGNGDGPPIRLVLHAFRIQDGRIVAEYQSEPFEVASGGEVTPNVRLLPSVDFFGSKAITQDSVIEARTGVPAREGVSDPSRFVGQGTFWDRRPDDWQRREVVYLIAVPADARLLQDALAMPILVYVN